MIHHSDDLDKIAQEKDFLGCRASLKAGATRYVSCAKHKVYLQAFEHAYREGYIRPELEVTLVFINQGVLVYERPIQDVRPIVESAQTTVKAKVPSSVIQKMLISRFREIQRIVRTENTYYADPVFNKMNTYHNIQMPQFRTIQSVRDFLDFASQRQNSGLNFDFSAIRTEMKKTVLRKPELTDDDVSVATDMLSIQDVMEA